MLYFPFYFWRTGSGRTGVVIAIDAMLDMMRGPEGKVGIYDFVKKMREIRRQMVESEVSKTISL